MSAPPIIAKLDVAIETLRACMREIPGHELSIGPDGLTLWECDERGGGTGVSEVKDSKTLVEYMNTIAAH